MKKPEEILKQAIDSFEDGGRWVKDNVGTKYIREDVALKAIDIAWNEAIDACILKGKNGFYTTKEGVSDRILIDVEELKKLKK